MTRSIDLEIKVGIFVAFGVGLVLFTIMLLGGGRTLFEKGTTFSAKFPQVEGLVEGATVKVAGVKVGQVKTIEFQSEHNLVNVTFSVNEQFASAVREDSTVGIQTQGVLGDRYIVVNPGGLSSKAAADGTELKAEHPKDLKDYLSNADEVLDRVKNTLKNAEAILTNFNRDNRSDLFFKNLTEMTENLSGATDGLPTKMKDVTTAAKHMKSILAKIDNGEGTVGALINDPSLYDDVKNLLGGANRNKVL
ncbi:MAG TPA: MlaD family protein, partial [Oligoflexia bacterium]|nr:MlaD family protein [Oligoflexia bacterium]